MENKYPESVGTNAMQISGSRVTLAAEAGAVEKREEEQQVWSSDPWWGLVCKGLSHR